MLEGLITGVILTVIILVIINAIVINDLTHRIEDLETESLIKEIKNKVNSITKMNDKEFVDFCSAFEYKLSKLIEQIPEIEELTKEMDNKWKTK